MANKRVYRAKAVEVGIGETGTGKESVAVSFQILTPDAPEQRLTWYGYFTDATFDRTIESLRHCGWKGDDLSNITGLDQEVELVVEDEEYEGKVNAKVQWVNKPGLALKAPITGDRAKAFAAQMRDRIRALDAAGGRKPAAKASGPSNPRQGGAIPPEPPPLGDADIPF